MYLYLYLPFCSTPSPPPSSSSLPPSLPPFFLPSLTFSYFLSLSLSPSQWEVATLALDVLYKLLSSHEFTEEDFTDITYQIPNRDSEVAILPKSPGHSLLIHLMNASHFLKKVSTPSLSTNPFFPPTLQDRNSDIKSV